MQNTEKYGINTELILAIVIIIIGIILRIKVYLTNLSFWVDEDALIRNAQGILEGRYHFFRGLAEEYSPPVFLLITRWVYGIFGHNELAFRFFPMLYSVITLPLFAVLAKKVIKTKYLFLLPLAYIVFNNEILFNTQYFKFYSLDFLCSVIISLGVFFIDYNKITLKKIIFFALIAGIMSWSAYSAIFYLMGIICGLFILLLKNNTKKNWINYLIFSIPFLIMTLFYYHEVCIRRINYDTYLHESWQLLGNFAPKTMNDLCWLFNYHTGIFPQNNIVIMAIFVLLIGLSVMMRKNSVRTLLFISPVIIMLILGYMDKFPFIGRQTLYLMPQWLIVFTSAIDYSYYKNLNKKLCVIPILAVILLIFIFKNFNINYIKEVWNNKDYYRMSTARELYKYLKTDYKRGEKIYSAKRDASLRIYDINMNRIDFINDVEECSDFEEFINKTDNKTLINIYIKDYPYIGDGMTKAYEWIKENGVIEKAVTDGDGIYIKFRKK